MRAVTEVLHLLAEWRRLTEREGEAIQNGDWADVAKCQDGKGNLCLDITRAMEEMRTGAVGLEQAVAEAECRFAAIAGELVELESANRDLICAQRERHRSEWERLNHASRNLHGVRRAYGAASPQLWHSYS
jgi:hypothetical protein